MAVVSLLSHSLCTITECRILENNGTVVFSNDKTFFLSVVNTGQLVCIEMARHTCSHTHTHTQAWGSHELFLFLCEKACRLKTGTQNEDKGVIGV